MKHIDFLDYRELKPRLLPILELRKDLQSAAGMSYFRFMELQIMARLSSLLQAADNIHSAEHRSNSPKYLERIQHSLADDLANPAALFKGHEFQISSPMYPSALKLGRLASIEEMQRRGMDLTVDVELRAVAKGVIQTLSQTIDVNSIRTGRFRCSACPEWGFVSWTTFVSCFCFGAELFYQELSLLFLSFPRDMCSNCSFALLAEALPQILRTG